MGLLCDFMYHGQVNVQQDRLPRFNFHNLCLWACVNFKFDALHCSFLALASRLEVKGLTQTSEEKEKNEESAAKVIIFLPCGDWGPLQWGSICIHRLSVQVAKKEKPVATGSVVPVYDFEGDGEDISNRGLVKEEEGADADGYLESGGLDFTGSSYSQYGYQDSIGILPSDFSPKGHPFYVSLIH